VSEAFFDGLDVGSAGAEPGGVGVAQVVEADGDGELGGSGGGGPDVVAEPASGYMSVGGDDAGAAGVVCAGGASVGSVGRERCFAVGAAAAAPPVRKAPSSSSRDSETAPDPSRARIRGWPSVAGGGESGVSASW
jgi:hypothetical protein